MRQYGKLYRRKTVSTKLTVLVPDELHRRARAVAALKGDNISNVVREALAEYVTEALQDAEDARAAREILMRVESGEEKTYSHDEIWAEIADLEKKGELRA